MTVDVLDVVNVTMMTKIECNHIWIMRNGGEVNFNLELKDINLNENVEVRRYMNYIKEEIKKALSDTTIRFCPICFEVEVLSNTEE